MCSCYEYSTCFLSQEFVLSAVFVLTELQFSSDQNGIYAIGKGHMRAAQFPRCCPLKRAVPVDDSPFSSFQGRSLSGFYASLLQAIDGVMSSPLCPQAASQAPQHFKSSEKQAASDVCFTCHQFICSREVGTCVAHKLSDIANCALSVLRALPLANYLCEKSVD